MVFFADIEFFIGAAVGVGFFGVCFGFCFPPPVPCVAADADAVELEPSSFDFCDLLLSDEEPACVFFAK